MPRGHRRSHVDDLRPAHSVAVTRKRRGVVVAELRLEPPLDEKGKRRALTPDDLHNGMRALGVLLRVELYPSLPDAKGHIHDLAALGEALGDQSFDEANDDED